MKFAWQVMACLCSLATLSGCMTMDITQPQYQDKAQAKVDEARQKTQPSFFIRKGDQLNYVLKQIGAIDGKVYILTSDPLALDGESSAIYSIDDLKMYMEAHGYELLVEPVREDSPYQRVSVRKLELDVTPQMTACKATLYGDLPLGFALTDICREAGLKCTYDDPGALAYAGVLYTMSFSGSCLEGLDYLAKKGGLVVNRKRDEVVIRMMESAVIDLGLPLRDRKIALDILADSGNNNNNGTYSGTSSNNSSVYGNGTNSSGEKSSQSLYYTDYIRNVKLLLNSMKTPFGTWNYLPETGQIFIRDRAEAVAAMKESLNRMVQSMQTRFLVRVMFYRLTVNKDRQVEGSYVRQISDKWHVKFGGGNITNPDVSFGKDVIIDFLSQFGTIETFDEYEMMLQAGMPQTIKIANNREYVRNISTVTTGVSGTVTEGLDQANATDGAFITIQARAAESGRIAIDMGAFINKLDGFDETKTASAVVKSQRSFERTFDSMAIVDEKVPYLMTITRQKGRDDASHAIPGLENTGVLGALLGGFRKDNSTESYIIVVLEAEKR